MRIPGPEYDDRVQRPVCTAAEPCRDRVRLSERHGEMRQELVLFNGDEWWLRVQGGRSLMFVYFCPWCGGRLA